VASRIRGPPGLRVCLPQALAPAGLPTSSPSNSPSRIGENCFEHWITRAETDADIPAIREINLAAFDTAEEADLVDALRTDPA
jgi:hypothetical protein